MTSLLFVTSSLFGKDGKSSLIAAELVDAWRQSHPGTKVAERHLDSESIPHLSGSTLGAVFAPAEQRSDAQRKAVAFADELIEEVEAADTLVLAVPMYNFSIPSTFKAWIDHITRAGRTFRYAENGPEGLLKSKKVFLIVSRGGVYTGESPAKAFDFQEPYLRWMLGFIGLSDLTFIHVEGQQISPDAATAGLDRARRTIGDVLPEGASAA
jgi:FMN-dependent NADH-azoreductase